MIEMEETKQLIQEIVEAKRSIISIDANDIKDTFQGDSPIYGFTVSVSPALDFRTEVLFDEIREKAEQFKPFNKVLLFFFISDISPLTMDELYPLNEWMEEFQITFCPKRLDEKLFLCIFAPIKVFNHSIFS